MPKFHPLKVKEVRRETKDAVSVAFEVPEALLTDYQFIQGQYLTLKAVINEEEVRRNYSVCVSPLENELRVAIKKVPGGRFSTYANEVLNAGDTIEVMTPMGKFFTEVKTENKKNYLGFAGGSGITPIISIMKTVLEVEAESTFVLFYGNRGVESIIFKEAIEALKNKYMERLTVHHVFSQERLDSDLFNGYISLEKCKKFANLLFDPKDIDEVFICGPEPMMLAISEALTLEGIDKKQIHFELFAAPGSKSKKEERQSVEEVIVDTGELSEISIRLDGNTFQFSLPYVGENILDAALKQGADLPFACKGGVCATCRAKLVEGKVEMDINYALEADELAAGFILTCQSHPRSEKIIVDFDEA